MVESGLDWLSRLQNRDGGIPTFCRGWGRLPFDKSCPDLTAHALRAWSSWGEDGESTRSIDRATRFLVDSQRPSGEWVPLWFGNQSEQNKENPVYGTSRVLRAAASGRAGDAWNRAMERGLAWLEGAQGEYGGFGGAPGLTATLEETALALEALCDCFDAGIGGEDLGQRIDAAAGWLVRATDEGRRFEASPIGLYFAQLWYTERLYPLAFTVSALGRAAEVL